MPCCGRRNLTPKQQDKYDRAMIDALSVYRTHGRNSPEAHQAFDSVRKIVAEKEITAVERAKKILKKARGENDFRT